MWKLGMAVILTSVLIQDCGGTGSEPGDLDPDATPVTGGVWYQPDASTDYTIQLQGTIKTTYAVDVYDIDLFDTPQATIDTLHARGIFVVCYFSSGSAEEWREDFDQFQESDLGNPLYGWPGEWWVDVRSANVLDIMLARLDLAADRGCDGVDPDNVDAYTNNSGFPLTYTDQLAYNRRIANEAHLRGLSVGLKNDLDQIEDLVAYYDFTVNEQCHEYDECSVLTPWIDADKPVFSIEYADSEAAAQAKAAQICPLSNALGLTTLIMPLELDGSWRVACE